jgi:hypothetical protein
MGTVGRRSRRWLSSVLVLGVIGSLTACSGGGGEGCGGQEDIISCVSITDVQPTATAGGETSDVDVVFNPDCDSDPTTDDPEPFTAHDAVFTFSNQAHPSASGSLDVTLQHVRITYNPTNCPVAAICPPLSEISQDVSLVIPEDTTGVTETFPLVPLSTKNEFIALGGSANAFPSYTATYIFTARTLSFSDTFTIEGSVNFVLGNFNLCQ